MDSKKINVKLDELLSALSLALDLAEDRSLMHSKRTAYIAFSIANRANTDDLTRENVYYASFLHDIGISKLDQKANIRTIHGDEDLKSLHSKKGYEIVQNLPFDDKIAKYIKYHHENYDGSGPFKLCGEDIPFGAQIICIADYFDIHYDRLNDSKLERDRMRSLISSQRGIMFKDELVDIMLLLMKTDRFWLDLSVNLDYEILNTIKPDKSRLLTLDEIEKIAEVFAEIVDGKSNFTYLHSKSISERVYRFAIEMGFTREKSQKMKIAGYLHDIGKLAVPNEILDKNGALTKEEFNIIRSHPYYTKLILSQVNGFRDTIARWAGNHHEKLKGNGYPEKLSGDQISIEDQMVAICDIYEALVEDRPYRDGLCKDKALEIMDKIIKDGHLDKELYLKFIKTL